MLTFLDLTIDTRGKGNIIMIINNTLVCPGPFFPQQINLLFSSSLLILLKLVFCIIFSPIFFFKYFSPWTIFYDLLLLFYISSTKINFPSVLFSQNSCQNSKISRTLLTLPITSAMIRIHVCVHFNKYHMQYVCV